MPLLAARPPDPERATARQAQGAASIVFASDAAGPWDLYEVPETGGAPTPLTQDAAVDMGPAVSPDGSLVAFSSTRAGSFDLYVRDLGTGQDRRVTTGPAADADASWSPDAESLVFERSVRGRRFIATVPATGGAVRTVVASPGRNVDPRFMPDGRRIVYSGARDSRSFDLFVTTLAGRRSRLTRGPADDMHPAVSPDGDRIVFERGVADRFDLYLLDVRKRSLRRLTANDADELDADFEPPDGERIVFARAGDGPYELHVLDVRTRKTTRVATGTGADELSPVWRRHGAATARASRSATAALAGCKWTGTDSRNVKADSGIDHVLCGRGGNDDLTGNAAGGGDRLVGDPGRDLLVGGGAADRLYGGRNYAGRNPDQLRGRSGDDTLFARGDGARDCVWGGDDDDSATLSSTDNRDPAPNRTPAWDVSRCGDGATIEYEI